MEKKFYTGDLIEVVKHPAVTNPEDVAGKKGIIIRFSHVVSGKNVYEVSLDDRAKPIYLPESAMKPIKEKEIMSEQKFHQDQRVKVVAQPYEDDKDLAGQSGTIANYSHVDAGGKVYVVRFAGTTGWRMLYEKDLIVEDEAEVLAEKRAKLEAEIKEIDKKLENLHLDGLVPRFGSGTAIHADGTLVIKIRDNWWHWFSVDSSGVQHHSNSEDKAIVSELRHWRSLGTEYKVFPADQD